MWSLCYKNMVWTWRLKPKAGSTATDSHGVCHLFIVKINIIKESNWTAFFYFIFQVWQRPRVKVYRAWTSILTFVSPWPIYVLSTQYFNCLPKPQVGFDTIFVVTISQQVGKEEYRGNTVKLHMATGAWSSQLAFLITWVSWSKSCDWHLQFCKSPNPQNT